MYVFPFNQKAALSLVIILDYRSTLTHPKLVVSVFHVFPSAAPPLLLVLLLKPTSLPFRATSGPKT